MSSEVLHPDVLDGQRDAAGAVGDAVARTALLELLVFDVVTQQLVVRAPPLDGQLRELSVVLIVIGTRQGDPLTRLTELSLNTACRQKRSRVKTNKSHDDASLVTSPFVAERRLAI